MTSRWLLVLALFLLPLSPMLAADPASDSIAFGNVRLTLGLPQEQVINLLGMQYVVELAPKYPRQRSNYYWVSSKTKPEGGAIGTLYFSAGTLTEADRYWTGSEPAAQPVLNTLKALFSAMSLTVPDLPRQCTIDLTRPPGERSEIVAMCIRCGNKTVSINIVTNVHPGQDDSVSITEFIGMPYPSRPSGQSDR